MKFLPACFCVRPFYLSGNNYEAGCSQNDNTPTKGRMSFECNALLWDNTQIKNADEK